MCASITLVYIIYVFSTLILNIWRNKTYVQWNAYTPNARNSKPKSVRMCSGDFSELRSTKTTTCKNHPYKLIKRQCPCTVRLYLFTKRTVNIWKCWPSDTVDFSHFLHLGAQLKVLISENNFLNFTKLFCVGLLVLWFTFIFFPKGRLLVLFFSLVIPATVVSRVLHALYLCSFYNK